MEVFLHALSPCDIFFLLLQCNTSSKSDGIMAEIKQSANSIRKYSTYFLPEFHFTCVGLLLFSLISIFPRIFRAKDQIWWDTSFWRSVSFLANFFVTAEEWWLPRDIFDIWLLIAWFLKNWYWIKDKFCNMKSYWLDIFSMNQLSIMKLFELFFFRKKNVYIYIYTQKISLKFHFEMFNFFLLRFRRKNIIQKNFT